jgi:hypothetical protein
MSVSRRGKTEGPLKHDAKLIQQESASSTLEVGQLVYLDDDGLYKPAIASLGTPKTSIVVGVVWSFEGPNQFYLQQTDSPLFYRFPLTKDYFEVDTNGRVRENAPNAVKIPGNLGDYLYLSHVTPGGLSHVAPYDDLCQVIVGTKQPYGWLYQPNLNSCTVEITAGVT